MNKKITRIMLTMVMIIAILQAKGGTQACDNMVTGGAVMGTVCSAGALDGEVENILATGTGVEAYEETEFENVTAGSISAVTGAALSLESIAGCSVTGEEMKETVDEARDATAFFSRMSDAVLDTPTRVKSKLLFTNYPCYKKGIISKKQTTKYILGVKNYNQKWLNWYYNKCRKANIDGSCTEVAGTSLQEYYTRKKYAKTYAIGDYRNAFTKLVDLGIKNGAYNKKSTQNGLAKNILTDYYRYFKRPLIGGFMTKNLYNRVKAKNATGKPVIGHFRVGAEGHSMIIIGCYKYEYYVQATKKNSSKVKATKYVYAVCDGWHDCAKGDERVAYIFADYLKSITELVNK